MPLSTLALALSAFAVTAVVADAALSVPAWSPVCVLFVVLVAEIAVSATAAIRCHRQSSPENLTLRVKDFFQRVTRLRALNDGLCFHADKIRQKCGDVFNSANGHLSGASNVVHLLSTRCPSTVRRLVVSVVVDALQGKPSRPRAHVLSESNEVLSPSLAHGNASPAVVLKSVIIWIKTSLFHRVPRGIKRMLRSAHIQIIGRDIKTCQGGAYSF